MKAYKESIQIPGIPVKNFISKGRERNQIAAHPHWHDAVELLYVTKGRARQQIDENFFTVSPDDIIVIWSNQIHSTYSMPNEECKMEVMQFIPEDILCSAQALHFTGPVSPSNNVYRQILNLMLLLSNELKNRADGFEYAVKAEIYRFYALMVRNIDKLPVQVGKFHRKKDAIVKIFEYIDHNYNTPITLKSASDHVHLSVAQFMRIFKMATGMTFKYYLNLYRIQKSQLLLSQGETVMRTAELCGFSNVNTFIRLFKQHKRCTPSQYVNQSCFPNN
ncbi:MAG: AraC family transcriptional regulator [Firmicutes bacterium]|nr:AraC family transcriptional regulator [Bacillota bacterium]